MDIEEILLYVQAEQDVQDAEALAAIPRYIYMKLDPFQKLSEARFVKLFRLNKNLTNVLINSIRHFMQAPSRKSALTIETKVLATLRFYATGSYQEIVGSNIFSGISQSSISRSINEVTKALNQHEIFNQWVKFPQNLEELRQLRTRFFQKYQLPGIVGCIDCTHIAIISPWVNDPDHPEHIYINRKNYHSINVQLICDTDLKILNINAKFPGSTHDVYIWRESQVSDVMDRIYRRDPEDLFFLIGDSGCPHRPWLMTPLADVEDPVSPELRFHEAFLTARCTIERCNGVLKNRFRCLLKERVLRYHPTKAGEIANACAILHNMCLPENVPEPPQLNINIDGLDVEAEHIREAIYQDLQRARQIRLNIIQHYFR